MHRHFLAALIVASTIAPRTALAQSAATPAIAVPSADPAITARAKDWLHRAQTGTIDRAQLTAQMDALLTDDLVKQAVTKLGPLGDPTDFSLVDMRNVAGSNVYMYRAQFKSGPLDEVLSIDGTGKINGLRFLPAQ
jgi:hypothetical protein